jgi:phage terminase large subunit-like protein
VALVYRGEIVVPSTGSRYRVLSRDSKPQHGMNLSGVIVDELHAHRDAELYRVITSSTGSRRQPLTFVITTASAEEHSIAAEVYRYATQVRDGVIDDPSFHSVIYSAPEDADPWSPKTWRASNPALRSGFRSLDELRTAALQARAIPAREASFRQLYLNQWGAVAADTWLPLAAWDGSAGAPLDRAALAGRQCYLGVDLSSTRDLSAVVAIFPDDAGGYDVACDFFAPAENVAERVGRDRVPYELWAHQGHLTLTEGNVVDYDAVGQRIRDYAAECEVLEVGFDRWNATAMMAELQRDGIPAVAVPQTIAGLTAGTKELERLVLTGKLRHGGQPVLRWCASNVVVERDHADNLKPSKRKSVERIDGISALVNALTRALESQGGSIYDTADPLLVAL